ncbi:MAG TPA: hypothetical protein VF588_04605 [Pyrinomonadaceae bacterium]
MRHALAFTIILTLAGLARAQAPAAAEAESARGLVLEQTTPAEAAKFFGAPVRDEVGKLKVLKIGRWLTPKVGEKAFRVQTFERVGDLEKIELAFLDDRLVSIHFSMKKRLPAGRLAGTYRVAFTPVTGELREDWGPDDYARKGSGVEVASYPATYHLLAVSKESFIAARVFNGGSDPEVGYGGVVGKRRNGPREMRTAAEPPAGAVTEVQILSRRLERPGLKR